MARPGDHLHAVQCLLAVPLERLVLHGVELHLPKALLLVVGDLLVQSGDLCLLLSIGGMLGASRWQRASRPGGLLLDSSMALSR